jgi:hypothetical protein
MSIIGGSQLGFRWRWPGGEPGLPDYPNPGFEDNFVGWTPVASRFTFNSTAIHGVTSPPNISPVPYGVGDVYGGTFLTPPTAGIVTHGSYGYITPLSVALGGYKCVSLKSSMVQSGGYGSLYGPYFYSNNPVFLSAGDSIEFYWASLASNNISENDAPLARAYGFTKSGKYIWLLNFSHPPKPPRSEYPVPWSKATYTLTAGQEGAYYFVFVCGSWDATGGTVVGSTLLVDSIVVKRNTIFTGE